MAEGFTGEIKTLWLSNNRDMTLLETFKYEDTDGKIWVVPSGSFLNGATIPQALWSIIGSPYTGNYRRASIIHDFFVGEGSNPDVAIGERKKADKMFYRACKFDGCSNREASILYIGVRVGTWYSDSILVDNAKLFKPQTTEILDSSLDIQVKGKFHKIYYNLEEHLDTIDIDDLEKRVDALEKPGQIF